MRAWLDDTLILIYTLSELVTIHAAPRKTPRFPHHFWLAVLHLHGRALTEHLQLCVATARVLFLYLIDCCTPSCAATVDL